MKITKAELKEMVRGVVRKKLQEQFLGYGDIVPGKEKALVEYAEEIDKFFEELYEKATELHDKGREIVKTEFFSSPEIAERNRFVLIRLGVLKKMIGQMVLAYEYLRREE